MKPDVHEISRDLWCLQAAIARAVVGSCVFFLIQFVWALFVILRRQDYTIILPVRFRVFRGGAGFSI